MTKNSALTAHPLWLVQYEDAAGKLARKRVFAGQSPDGIQRMVVAEARRMEEQVGGRILLYIRSIEPWTGPRVVGVRRNVIKVGMTKRSIGYERRLTLLVLESGKTMHPTDAVGGWAIPIQDETGDV